MSAQAWWRLFNGPDHRRAPHAGGRPLKIRFATPDDAVPLERLAQLDSKRPPRGVVLLADVEGALWAAVSLDDGHVVADPFRPSGELAYLLSQHARDVRRSEQGHMGRLPRVWPANPADELRFA